MRRKVRSPVDENELEALIARAARLRDDAQAVIAESQRIILDSRVTLARLRRYGMISPTLSDRV
jgi:hypothetical protein